MKTNLLTILITAERVVMVGAGSAVTGDNSGQAGEAATTIVRLAFISAMIRSGKISDKTTPPTDKEIH